MKTIAIVGAGPTGIYTLFSLLQQQTPLSISIFEQADEAGVGMPYSDDENSKLMLANIASIEIPPIYCTYLEWLQKQEASHLQRYGVKKETLHDRQFLPRILLGEYFRDQFLRLVIRRQLVLPTRANYTGRTLQCDIKSRLLLPSLSFSCSFHLSVRTYIRDGSAGLPPPPP